VKNYEFIFSQFQTEFVDREVDSISPDEILSFLTNSLTEPNKPPNAIVIPASRPSLISPKIPSIPTSKIRGTHPF
jgi:hypothetical protein